VNSIRKGRHRREPPRRWAPSGQGWGRATQETTPVESPASRWLRARPRLVRITGKALPLSAAKPRSAREHSGAETAKGGRAGAIQNDAQNGVVSSSPSAVNRGPGKSMAQASGGSITGGQPARPMSSTNGQGRAAGEANCVGTKSTVRTVTQCERGAEGGRPMRARPGVGPLGGHRRAPHGGPDSRTGCAGGRRDSAIRAPPPPLRPLWGTCQTGYPEETSVRTGDSGEPYDAIDLRPGEARNPGATPGKERGSARGIRGPVPTTFGVVLGET